MLKRFLPSTFLMTILLSACIALEAGSERSLPRYNITASSSNKFVWFRVAKVGTRSILQILRGQGKISLDGYGIPFNPKRYQDYYKFAFVRNPWDRVVSTYCSKVITRKHQPFKTCFGKSFEYFVDFINSQNISSCDAHIMLQTKLLPLAYVNFIGKMENFDADLHAVLDRIGLEYPQIPHRNPSDHAHYSHFYTKRTKDIVAKKYKDDIVNFGYQFELE